MQQKLLPADNTYFEHTAWPNLDLALPIMITVAILYSEQKLAGIDLLAGHSVVLAVQQLGLHCPHCQGDDVLRTKMTNIDMSNGMHDVRRSSGAPKFKSCICVLNMKCRKF